MAFGAGKQRYKIDPVAEMLESRVKAELAANTRFNVAYKKGWAEGFAEGLAEGRAEGLAEGRTEGLAEVRAEDTIELARKLGELGSTPEFIEAATGLKPGDY